MLDAMPADVFLAWREYEMLEPFGAVRGDLQAGVVAAAVHNAMGSKRKGGGTFSAVDFTLEFGADAESRRPKPLTSVEDWKRIKGGLIEHAAAISAATAVKAKGRKEG